MTVTPEGRRLLRIEARNSTTPVDRKPPWMRAKVNLGPEYRDVKRAVEGSDLHTVCQEAGCPNIYECWEAREATFLIGGDACTRRCDFCQIESAKPTEYDRDEPARVADSVVRMDLRYATITGVCRDDLEDLGSWLYAETIRQVRAQAPGVGVEMLAPDFNARPDLLQPIFDAHPSVFAHNVETVPRLFKQIRPGFTYERSLDVLRQSRDAGMVTKSNLILGMGESNDDVSEALADLYEAGCELITITQYLRPNKFLRPVDRWVTPDEFASFEQEAYEIGYAGVMSGPLVRSSYKAGNMYAQALENRKKQETTRGQE